MHSGIGKINSLNYLLFKFKDNILIFRYVFRFRHENLNKNKHFLSQTCFVHFVLYLEGLRTKLQYSARAQMGKIFLYAAKCDVQFFMKAPITSCQFKNI